MFVGGYQEVTRPQRGMGTLGEGPNRPEIGTKSSAPAINYCSGFEPEKIDRPKPAWIPADWGDHYDTLYNYCNFGHEGKSERAYGDVIGYRIDPGNSTYQYYDTNGKFLYATPRAKGGIPAPLIAAAIAIIAPPLAAAVNEYLTGAEIFTDAATTQAVSNGIANTTLQVASGTPIKKAITGNVTSTLIQTQSADATNAVDSVLNNPDVSAAIVTTAGIIVKNQAAGKSTAEVSRAATSSITSPAAVTAVTAAAANIPAKVTTMSTIEQSVLDLYHRPQIVTMRQKMGVSIEPTQDEINYWVNQFGPTFDQQDITSFDNAATLAYAQSQITAGKTLQQITDDVNAFFNKTFTTQNVSDYLAANNLTIQAAQTATGLSSNTLMLIGGGLLLLLLLRK